MKSLFIIAWELPKGLSMLVAIMPCFVLSLKDIGIDGQVVNNAFLYNLNMAIKGNIFSTWL